jgi:NAD(P)-dependent dehydrogenase (short-subunit alcohol dehydrogenase family)
MRPRLKPLREQVMVITGASSGIGLTTAEMAAAQGARVVLAARNEHDLADAVANIRRAGGRATAVVADVADPAQVESVAAAAIREVGRIDTWVNCAAASVYGRVTQMSLEDQRRQFDVTYWGQVHGCRTAVAHMRNQGGALINVGSCVSDRAIPLQGTYCAAKHALKAFTDTLRMELAEAGVPISVTLVKPASINTPFFDKARSYMATEPQPVPPVYAPEVVARAILTAAQRPVRDVITGGAGRMLGLSNVLPMLTDRYMERTMFRSQQTNRPTNGRPDNLHRPVARDGGRRGQNWTGRTIESSAYTAATLAARQTLSAAIGVAFVIGAAAYGVRALMRPGELRSHAA